MSKFSVSLLGWKHAIKNISFQTPPYFPGGVKLINVDPTKLPPNFGSKQGSAHFPMFSQYAEGIFRGLISSLNEFRYNLPYPEMKGSALSIISDQFSILNGFSNQFYGLELRMMSFTAADSLTTIFRPSALRLKHTKQSLKSSIET